MKKLSAILVMVLVFAMTVVPVSAAGEGYVLTPSATTVAAGEQFTIDVTYTPASMEVWTADVLVGYDTALVKYVSATPAVTGQTFTPKADATAGTLTLVIATDMSVYYTGGKLATITFEALADVNGNAAFTVGLPASGAITDSAWTGYSDITGTGTTVAIGNVIPEPPVVEKKFEVSAVENTDKTVVTVKDSSEVAAGTVYVANYVDDVLVSCESKPLADGDLEFAITGNVKVFVWDANNVPLVNEVIEL
jgi:hypothetical protein